MDGIASNAPACRGNNGTVATKTRNTTGVMIFVTIKSLSRCEISMSVLYQSEKRISRETGGFARFLPYRVMDLKIVSPGLLRAIPNVFPEAIDSLRKIRTMASATNLEKQLKTSPIHLLQPPEKYVGFSDIRIR